MKIPAPCLRFLDHIALSPILFLLGLITPRRPRPDPIRTIGLLKYTGMGDLVLATAIINDLRAAFPQARLILFCGPRVHPLGKLLASVNETVLLPKNSIGRSSALLRHQPLDVLLDLGQWGRYEALVTVLSGARFRAGFETPGQHRHYAYDASVLHSRHQHEVDNYRDLTRLLGIPTGAAPSVPLRSTATTAKTKPGHYVAFHLWPLPGPDNNQRRWPAEHWRQLIRYYNARHLTVALTGGPGDRVQTADFLATCDWPDAAVIDATEDQLLHSIDWLQHAELVISVNTGIMHLAAALGRPLVGLHGPTSVKRWGPIGPRAVAVKSSAPGAGYLHLGIEYDNRPELDSLMDAITVPEVIAAAERAMAL